ncbi:MAG TPA: nitrous oxide reductase accessory protein NosL [Gemmatimonadaceae bacterium]
MTPLRARQVARFSPIARALGAIATLLLVLVACSAAPVPIAYGQDSCDYCRMQISDPRYGGELITRTGKVLKFDSIECLASYYVGLADGSTVSSTWVSDYKRPGTLISADSATFLRHGGPGSPMGRGFLALAGRADAAALAASLNGDILTWSDVLKLVGRDALRPGGGADGAGARTTDMASRARTH